MEDTDQAEKKAERLGLEVQRSVAELTRLRGRSKKTVSLLILHPFLPAAEITALMSIRPSSTLARGASLAPGFGPEKRLKTDRTHWTLKTGKYVKHDLLEAHIEWILQILEGRTPTLRQWLAEGAHLQIRVHERSFLRLNAWRLDAHLLARLAHLGVGLDILCHYQNTDADY